MNDEDLMRQIDRLRICRACGHDLITQHDPEDEKCDAFAGVDVGVCPCGRTSVQIGDHVLTVLERLREEEKRRRAADRWALIVTDLDRCEHGRHEGEVCGSCNGPSHGNPIAAQHGRRVGFNLSGLPYRIPTDRRPRFTDPDAWLVVGACTLSP